MSQQKYYGRAHNRGDEDISVHLPYMDDYQPKATIIKARNETIIYPVTAEGAAKLINLYGATMNPKKRPDGSTFIIFEFDI